MRRVLLLLVVAAAVLALAAGLVLAETFSCTGPCVGTREADMMTGSATLDRIAGMEGNDTITGGAGDDQMYGDEGGDTIMDNSNTEDNDAVFADEGNDTINVREGEGVAGADTVFCGPGKKDKVFFDENMDFLHKGCEIRRGS